MKGFSLIKLWPRGAITTTLPAPVNCDFRLRFFWGERNNLASRCEAGASGMLMWRNERLFEWFSVMSWEDLWVIWNVFPHTIITLLLLVRLKSAAITSNNPDSQLKTADKSDVFSLFYSNWKFMHLFTSSLWWFPSSVIKYWTLSPESKQSDLPTN